MKRDTLTIGRENHSATLTETKNGILVTLYSRVYRERTGAAVLLKVRPQMAFDAMFSDSTTYAEYLVYAAKSVLNDGADKYSRILKKGEIIR